MKKNLKLIIVLLIFSLGLIFFKQNIAAQDFTFCDFVPCADLPEGAADETSLSVIERLIYFGFSAIFVVIVAYGIFIIIKGALTIIRSDGSDEEIQKGAQTLKGVFIGVIILIVGIIGLVILFTLFQAGGLANVEVETPPGVDQIPL